MSAKRIRRTEARLEGESRRDRENDDREVSGDRVQMDEVRLEEFRNSHYQSVLPDLPKIPGYHVCWLTTNNPSDTIARRMRLGYEPIKAADIPGYEAVSLKTGDYVGCIGVNEMIAFKIPLHLYESFMKESHHVQPLGEEEKLRSARDQIMEQAASEARSGARGIEIEEEEGMAGLGRDPGSPSFADVHGES